MTKKPVHKPATRQIQPTTTTVELVDPVPSLRLPTPRRCPYAAAAPQTRSRTRQPTGSHLSTGNASGAESDTPSLLANHAAAATDAGADELVHVHVRAYHYFDAAYPDHSLRVARSADPRYPAGEYPEGAHPTDAHPAARADLDSDSNSQPESESGLLDDKDYDIEDEHEDEHEGYGRCDTEDIDPRTDFLYHGDEDGGGGAHEGWDWEGHVDEAADREDADTGVGDLAKDVDDIKGPETDAAAAPAPAPARPRRGPGAINHGPYHHVDDARQAPPNLVRRTLVTVGACVGLMYPWNWSLNRPRHLTL